MNQDAIKKRGRPFGIFKPYRYFNEWDRKNAIKDSKIAYMTKKPWFCSICCNNKDYTLAGKFMHCKTRKHINETESIKLPDNIETKCILKMLESGEAKITKNLTILTLMRIIEN